MDKVNTYSEIITKSHFNKILDHFLESYAMIYCTKTCIFHSKIFSGTL